MSLEYKISKAKHSDVEAIYDVRLIAWLDTYPNAHLGITKEDLRVTIEGPHGERRAERIAKHTERILKSPNNEAVFVARKHGHVVGFSTALVKDDKQRLGALYVLPNEQRNGIGTALLEAVMQWHASDKPIYLSVVNYNDRAIRFYKKHGFEPIGPVPEYLSTKLYNGKILPETEMVLKSR